MNFQFFCVVFSLTVFCCVTQKDSECPPRWFDCGNGRCVAALWRCDGEDDCGNMKDEHGCEYTQSTCLSSQFGCESDKHCIPEKWQCDGDQDCDDGSDEMHCDSSTDECVGFRCQDNHCIHQKWFCDGQKDCPDGSDEVCTPATLCADDQFLCSSGSCLNRSLVCDGKKDCSDGSDEGLHCGDPCENATCSQQCKTTPSGPQCYCDNGYQLDPKDNKTCLDIDECMEEGFCSQICANTRGSFNCSCLEGYELINRTCRAIGEDPLLIFSTLQEIRAMNLRTDRNFLIQKALQKSTAVDADPINQRVYWVDISNHSAIYSAKFDGTDLRTVLNHGLRIPEGIAVDDVGKNLYITDSGLKQVLVCKMDGTMCHVLHDTNIEKPRSLALDVSKGFLYWSDWGEKAPGIYRSGMDGSGRIHLVSKNIGWPNGIVIDHSVNRLYWVDAERHSIEYISLDGNTRKVVLNETVFHPYSLTVFEDTLYWTEWFTFSLESCNKFTGHKMTLITGEHSKFIMGVHVYHPVLVRKVTNPCLSNDCSHMCLIAPGNTFRCACPSGFDLAADGKTCTKENCTAENFQCISNGWCVPQRFRCDGKRDCEDGSDEIECRKDCDAEEFQCISSGRCFPQRFRCDGERDCEDGSDEIECRNLCLASDFSCKNGRCILKSSRCDGRNDCLDNSDEEGCPEVAVCTEDQMSCGDGECIAILWLCDGEKDCVDGRDELNCNKSLCDSEKQLRCDNGQCIPISWLCDGSNDCYDGTDEKNCKNSPCQSEEFRCSSSKRCITKRWICDGDKDCEDGSDETNCEKRESVAPLPIPSVSATDCDGFFCYVTGQCLSWSKVCDGNQDCKDLPDEGGLCTKSCIHDKGGCAQICIKTPQGPKCACSRGYKLLPDQKTCDDIDECLEPGTCSHYCHNTKGGFKCSCADNYFLHHDHRLCKAIGGPATLVYLLSDKIRGIDLVSRTQRVYLSVNNADMRGMDYDASESIFYWTESNGGLINSYSPDTLQQNIIVRPSSRPLYVRYDWIAKNLYYTDDNGSIGVCSKDGKYCTTLIQSGNMHIDSMDISPTTGQIFWTIKKNPLKQHSGLIERAEMDGSRRLVIVSDKTNWPTAITVDHILHTVYWIDLKLNTLECADFQGFNRRQIVRQIMLHPFAMAIFEDHVYWADWGLDKIFRCEKFTGKICSNFHTGNAKAMMMMVIHSALQPRGINKCRNSKCPHLCLPTQLNFTCKCADGFVNDTCERSNNTTNERTDLICTEDYCLGGGKCRIEDGKRICQCPPNYSGDKCEIPPTTAHTRYQQVPQE